MKYYPAFLISELEGMGLASDHPYIKSLQIDTVFPVIEGIADQMLKNSLTYLQTFDIELKAEEYEGEQGNEGSDWGEHSDSELEQMTNPE